MQRLDRAFGELNSFLMAVAIGLAILDVTCFYALTVKHSVAAQWHAPASDKLAWSGLFPATPQLAAEDEPE